MITDVRAFADDLRGQAVNGDMDGALARIATFVLEVLSRDTAIARVFSSRELDALSLELGELAAVDIEPGDVDPDQCVFLVTGVAPTGGHTRVLLDLIVADGARKTTVLVTNLHQNLTPDDIADILRPTGVQFELSPDSGPASRLKWVQKRLAALRPARTYILQHHFDPICVAAVQPKLVDRLFYFHNCDHSLALGVHLPHAVHVDFNAKSFYHCREVEGVDGNVVWPLTVDDPGGEARSFSDTTYLTTCCCGGFEKFEQPHLAETVPYAIAYEEMVGAILMATSGRHVHIGPLSETMLTSIMAVLHRLSIPEARFVHITYAPELTQTLLDYKIDVFVGSAPRGGGRAMVEAMAVGLPMLVHSNYRTVFFSAENDVYEGAMIWRTLTDLSDHLVGLDAAALRTHADRSRAFFEAHHHPDRLRAAVEATRSGVERAPPARPMHQADALQAYLDERRAVGLQTPIEDVVPTRNITDLARTVQRISTADLGRLLGWRVLNKVKEVRLAARERKRRLAVKSSG